MSARHYWIPPYSPATPPSQSRCLAEHLEAAMFIRDHRGFLHFVSKRFGYNIEMDAINLRTTRLILEAIASDHALVLFDKLHDESLYEFIDDAPPTSVLTLQSRFERWAQRQSPDGQEIWLNWALKRTETNVYVGLVQATVRKDHSAAVAYILFRSFWGQGYAQEALAKMIRELRESYAVNHCTATVDPRNSRSIRLLQKLGFSQTACHRNAATIRGQSTDEARYSASLIDGA